MRTLNGGYFTFIHHADLNYFINRLTENAVRKYSAFTGEDFELDGSLFTYMIPRVRKNGMIDVFVEMKIHGKSFQVAGSTWKLLEAPVNGDNRDFYAFIMDAGIGELNPHGFGLINPIQRARYNARKGSPT